MNSCPLCKSNLNLVSQFTFCENGNCEFMKIESHDSFDDNVDCSTNSEDKEPIKDDDLVKKRYSINKLPEEYFSNVIFKNKDVKIVNWLLAPYLMKSHSRIVKAILLLLDSFGLVYDELVKARKEYYRIQSFGNFKVNFAKVNQLYDLLQCIYDMTPVIDSKELFGKNVNERIVMLLERVFNTYNADKVHYSSEINCKICGFRKFNYYEKYVVTIDGYVTKLTKTEIHVDINCPKCERKTAKEVFYNLLISKYLIFHFLNGVNKSLLGKLMNFKSSNLEIEPIEIISLVECPNKVVVEPSTENRMDRFSYLASDKIRRNYLNNSILHIHNTNGWYCLDENRALMIPPTDKPIIRSPSNLNICIFGTLTNPAEYKEKFNIVAYIKEHKERIKNDFETLIESPQITADNDQSPEQSNDIISTKDDTKCAENNTKTSFTMRRFVQFRKRRKNVIKNNNEARVAKKRRIASIDTKNMKRKSKSIQNMVNEEIGLLNKEVLTSNDNLLDPQDPGDINDLISKKWKSIVKK